MKKPRNSGGCRRASPSALDECFHPNRTGKAKIVLVGMVAFLSAVGFIILMMLQGTPQDTRVSRPSTQPDPHDADIPVTVKELEQETFAVARRLLEYFPMNPDALNLMANVQNQYDHTTEAVKFWRYSIQLAPQRVNARRGLAMIAMKKGDYEAAAEIWEWIRKRNPRLPDANGRYGQALLEMGKPAEALTALQEEVRISPGNGEYQFLLGRAHLQLHEYPEAVKYYEKALEIEPRNSKACYGLSVSYSRSGQPDKAKRMRDKLKSIRAEEDTAVSQRRKNDFNRDWAIQTLTRTLTGAGVVYNRNGVPQKAENCWRQAAALDEKSKACRHALADLHTQQGRLPEAIEICEQLQRIDPKVADYRLRAGTLYARLKQWAPAEKTLRKAIAITPQESTGYRILIQVLMAANQKLPEAKALAQRLVELHPNAQNYLLLGKVSEKIGDTVGALAAGRRAAEFNSTRK